MAITLQSSAISSVNYDFYQKVLSVEFVSGSLYDYMNVPEFIYVNLLNAPSKGKYVNSYIKKNFSYRLISTPAKRLFSQIGM